MTAHIYTDASFFPEHKVGSFALWINCGYHVIKYSGVLESADNSTEAESMAIANGLFLLLEKDLKINKLIIITDSEPSIKKIKVKAKDGSPYKVAYELLTEIRTKNKILVKLKDNFKHVPAHRGVNTVDKIINRWCDVEAKRVGREYVKQLKKNKL